MFNLLAFSFNFCLVKAVLGSLYFKLPWHYP